MIKEKNLLFTLISSTILTFAWIGFSVYHTSVTSTIDEDLSIQIIPIKPQFNQTAIAGIETRTNVEPLYEQIARPSSSSSATSVITPSPTEPEPSSVPLEEETP